jgi:hypothetical protein
MFVNRIIKSVQSYIGLIIGGDKALTNKMNFKLHCIYEYTLGIDPASNVEKEIGLVFKTHQLETTNAN